MNARSQVEAYSGAKSKYQLALELPGIDKNKIANNALIEMAKQQVIMNKSIT